MELMTGDWVESGITGLFFLLLLAFTLHTVFLTYHWFSFGTSKRTSVTALAVYLVGGAVFFLAFSIALNTL